MDENDRSKRVLAALVRQYIATGEPIASSVLAASAGLGVSSATVRNLLVRLEEEGYLSQPHTSAAMRRMASTERSTSASLVA